MSGITKMFKPKSAPAAPEPAVLPDIDDEAVKRAERRSRAGRRAQSGARSTIRPGAGGTLGAGTVLGNAGATQKLGGG